MKSLYYHFGFLLLSCFSSCNKDEQAAKENIFIKNIVTDADFAAVSSMQLDDGNYLIIAYDQLNYPAFRNPGHMIKIDAG